MPGPQARLHSDLRPVSLVLQVHPLSPVLRAHLLVVQRLLLRSDPRRRRRVRVERRWFTVEQLVLSQRVQAARHSMIDVSGVVTLAWAVVGAAVVTRMAG